VKQLENEALDRYPLTEILTAQQVPEAAAECMGPSESRLGHVWAVGRLDIQINEVIFL
jgi:hypothetical protein